MLDGHVEVIRSEREHWSQDQLEKVFEACKSAVNIKQLHLFHIITQM